MAEVRIAEAPVWRGGRRLLLGGGLAAVVGLALVGLGAVFDARRALFSYLVAFAWLLSMQLGALILLLIAHVTNARWMVVVRRLLEGMAGTLPLTAVLFVPIALGVGHLYPWVHPHGLEEHARHIVEHKARYLNVPFFLGRAVFYFAVWLVLALLLWRWSIARDRGAAPPETTRERILSAGGLPAVALTLTFAAFDWMMSLEPTWFSTAYGVYVFAGGFIAAIATLTIAAHLAGRAGLLADLVRGSHWHALGRMMLAFTIFWAYIGYFQAFIIYMANKPEEAPFYVARLTGRWSAVGTVLLLGHFVLPFLVLLLRDLKFRPALLASVAAWIVGMHFLDVYWLVLPAYAPGFQPHPLDLAALVGIGGAGVAFAAFCLRGHALVPARDPRLAASVTYRSL